MSVKTVSFIGRSGSGKTTLITRLIPTFVRLKLKIGTVKQTHHHTEFDKPGKDSWLHKQAGSQQVLVMSRDQQALYSDRIPDLTLQENVQKWFSEFDIVFSEGFKNESCLKIEVYRQSNNKSPLYKDPAFNVNAVVSDTPPELELPFFRFDDVEAIRDWILSQLDKTMG